METNYSKVESANTSMGTKSDKSNTEVNISSLEKDSFEPIEYEDVKSEDAIFEVFKAKDYTDIVSNIIHSIDNYYQDNDTFDDYPYFRVQNTCKFIPKLNIPSEILSERQLREVHAHLPYYHQYKSLKLLYSSSKHGVSIKTFYLQAEEIKNSILLIKDDNQNVFGAYVSEAFRNNNSVYGTGETFLFTFYKTERIHIFNSTGVNDYFIYSDDTQISFGCSDNYFSLSIDSDFLKGYSKTTQTFKNPPLTPNETFFISKLELWSFHDQVK